MLLIFSVMPSVSLDERFYDGLLNDWLFGNLEATNP